MVVRLTEDMKRVVRDELGFHATVCDDGSPNLSPKGCAFVWDDEHLFFADIRSPQTVANIRHGSTVEVNFVDPYLRKGYRFKGPAVVYDAGSPEFSIGVERLRLEGISSTTCGRVKAIVVLEVREAKPLRSPAYDDGRTTEAVLARTFHARFTTRHELLLDLGAGAQNEPFARHPPVPSFAVTSTTIANGLPWDEPQMSGAFGVPGGKDVSPQLSWTGTPRETKSYAVTVYDPDAPTASGFWHWAVANIPAATRELPEGAGDDAGSGLPDGAIQYRNDAGQHRFLGAAPPAGHGPHRYYISVYALDVADIDVPGEATAALLGFNLFGHTLARGTMIATAEVRA